MLALHHLEVKSTFAEDSELAWRLGVSEHFPDMQFARIQRGSATEDKSAVDLGGVMGQRLSGKVAIITGAGGGIGREYAYLLSAEGARVLVNDLGMAEAEDGQLVSAEKIAKEIRDRGGEAEASADSAATMAGAAAVVEAALDAFGRVDILINNATVVRSNDVWRFSEDDWNVICDVNLKGYFAMTKHIVPHFARQRDGVIINTSSSAGFGMPANVAYGAAKEGVVGLTRTVACEVGRFGIRCNAIRPTARTFHAKTAYVERSRPWAELIALTMPPLPKIPDGATREEVFHPRKVAPFVVWLCSPAARRVNGRTFAVAGDTVGLYSEPVVEKLIYAPGGWTLDALDVAAEQITGDLDNPYTLDDHPEWQRFGA